MVFYQISLKMQPEQNREMWKKVKLCEESATSYKEQILRDNKGLLRVKKL